MMHNAQQATSSDMWAAEWAEMRRTAMAHLRQQQLEQRMQEVDPTVQARVSEAKNYLLAALRSLETASKRHADTIRTRL